ncbi:hypothetical protein [Yoonia sp. 208BN28-4]|uniref:hypothetical protein n=1 Tax=Yoonia sp. 208BN28-4 TaxID=3126505 RepID=UPI0030999FEF
MSTRVFVLLSVVAAGLSACSSGTSSNGSILYDTDNPSPLANFQNGFNRPMPADSTISRVRFDDGTDTVTIDDPASPNTPIVVQNAVVNVPARQNLQAFVGGDAAVDGNNMVIGHENELITLNTQDRGSWAISLRETDYNTTNPNFAIWTDVARSSAFGGDIYTSVIDGRASQPNASTTMNGTFIYVGDSVSDAIVVGAPRTYNGTGDVALDVDFAADTIGGTVTNLSLIDVDTGAMLGAVNTTVFTLPSATLMADGTFENSASTSQTANGVVDTRDIALRGQINGAAADQASGAISISQGLTVQNGLGFGGLALQGTFVAEE